MSEIHNIPKARYDWIVSTMSLLQHGMSTIEHGDRFNAIHTLITLGLAYALGPPRARTYFLTVQGVEELQRIEALKGVKNEPA